MTKGLHSPNTSEYSKPHSSAAEPQLHVDQHHYGSNGQKDNSLTNAHITDKGAVSMGKETYEHHKSKK